MTQLAIHKSINEFLEAGPAAASSDGVIALLQNNDARRFFFSRAGEEWVEWLRDNNFFACLQEPARDKSQYSYRLPELEYLTRVAQKQPESVSSIIEDTPISEETFNPEVLDRFFWILGLLTVDQVKRLLPKAIKEGWVRLMSPFHTTIFEHKKILENVSSDPETLLLFARMVLAPRSKEDLSKIDGYIAPDKLFYLHDITSIGIFDQLVKLDGEYKQEALKRLLGVLASLVVSGNEPKYTFEHSEPFYLMDLDVFTAEVKESRAGYPSDDIDNVVAAARILIRDILDSLCPDGNKAKEFYVNAIEELPDSRTTYRLKLYSATRCPEVLADELSALLGRVFTVGDRYFDVVGGAEYEHVLEDFFGRLADDKQRDYISQAIAYFGEDIEDETGRQYRQERGRRLLSFIQDALLPEEKTKAEQVFGGLFDKEELHAQPEASQVEFGMVDHKSPVKLSDYTIEQIIDHLKTDWRPEELSKQFEGDHHLEPRGAEGLGDELGRDIKVRLSEYIQYIEGFYSREGINPHYLYSVLRGIEELLRDKQKLTIEQVGKLISLFGQIAEDGGEEPFARGDERSWLGDWITVHKVSVDIVLLLVRPGGDSKEIHEEHRTELLNIISYFLTVSDSPRPQDEDPQYGDLYHVAINSVRGRIYEAFVMFVEQDGDSLSDDIKKVFEEALSDRALSVRFVIGRYTASFYFRDKAYIGERLEDIFPVEDESREDVYLATWEGYLSNTLYDKLFPVLRDHYLHAISLDPKYIQRENMLRGWMNHWRFILGWLLLISGLKK